MHGYTHVPTSLANDITIIHLCVKALAYAECTIQPQYEQSTHICLNTGYKCIHTIDVHDGGHIQCTLTKSLFPR